MVNFRRASTRSGPGAVSDLHPKPDIRQTAGLQIQPLRFLKQLGQQVFNEQARERP